MNGSSEKTCRIAVVAPGRSIEPDIAERAGRVAHDVLSGRAELDFHPQCFLSDGHFAGDDAARLEALVEVANSPDYDAVWFARGGYGACRIAEAAVDRMQPLARDKRWLGYSDMGFLLASLDRAGFAKVAHGPMPIDLMREGGEAALERALRWLADGVHRTPEPAMSFNLTILSSLLGTPLEPDFADRVVQIEDVGEYMYRIDRALFHVTSSKSVRQGAGLRLGRISEVPDNDPAFNQSAEQIVRHWCEQSGIPFLGAADIGHDADNAVTPFR